MSRLLKAAVDPFLFALIATVVLATLLPAHGTGVRLFDILTDAAITLLFFLQGAKLSRQALLSGAGAWKLHGAVLTSTRSEEHTSELQSLMRNSYAVFCLKKHTKNELV